MEKFIGNDKYVNNANFLNLCISNYICKSLKNKVVKIYVEKNMLYLKCKKEDLFDIIYFLKNNFNLKYENLVDLSAVDLPNNNTFRVFYIFLSHFYNSRITVITDVPYRANINPTLTTVTFLFKGSQWLERECWDMFGIYFEENPDLRRILTDYGFKGFPLRKDFPLSGYYELYFDEIDKRIKQTKVNLAQDFREFYLDENWTKSF